MTERLRYRRVALHGTAIQVQLQVAVPRRKFGFSNANQFWIVADHGKE
ncbi:hypothetical protein [Microbacterium sp. MTN4-26]